MKILVIGGGGRESALVHTFARQGHRVWCTPGNAGTDALTEPFPASVKKPSMQDHEALIAAARAMKIDLTVVGPEQPLAEGIVDAFKKAGLKIFGPTAQAAALESDKAFSKTFMKKHAIPTASFVLCHSAAEAKKAVDTHLDAWGGAVIKPSGLTAGKGVICCHTKQEAYNAIKRIMEDKQYGASGEVVIVEEMLVGNELSILALSDGASIIPLIPSQDHKRLGVGGEGPNTGGIGAYAPTPFVTEKRRAEIDAIVEATNLGLKREGIDYRGVIYIGLMLTARGTFVLEYNCRFGDPEAQVVLPLMKSDLAKAMVACVEGHLDPDEIKWMKKYAACVVMVAEGYPFTYPTGDRITGLGNVEDDILIFHAGTKNDGAGRIVTAGGRVLGVTGIGDTLQQAVDRAYQGVKKIDFVSAYYRTDIGYKALHETAL